MPASTREWTHTSAVDLEAKPLTHAEIKANGSGKGMEQVDTEVRKLDQFRAVHFNQQHLPTPA
jgi:hypothetical protein